MPEPITVHLHRVDDDFPLPFITYVPEDMAASSEASDSTAHFTAEFGGVRNEDAFVHLYVFPQGTRAQKAIALAQGYRAGRGIPVSRGIEPIAEDLTPPHLEWALEAYRFRYQGEDGQWFGGTLGVSRHDDRYFMILRHYPAEYGDGFGPRANLITENWVWADGTRLDESSGTDASYPPAPGAPAGSAADPDTEPDPEG